MPGTEKNDGISALPEQTPRTGLKSVHEPTSPPQRQDLDGEQDSGQNKQRFWEVLRFFFIVGCAFSILPMINSVRRGVGDKDYALWYVVGRSVNEGKPLYEVLRNGEPDYMYPPTAAVLLYAPLSKLGPFAFTTILCLVNALAWPYAVWASSVLMSGKWIGRPCALTIGPGLAVAPYIWDIQTLGQLNLLLLALTLGAFLSLRKQRPFMTGGLFGAAVALKVFPLPAIAYFIVRGKWVAVLASILGIFAFIWFFPGVFRGFERNTVELKQWANLMIVDQSGETIAGRSSIGFSRRNQSLLSLSHRLLRHVDAGVDPNKPKFVNFANVAPKTAQLVGHGSCLLLGVILLLACRFRFGQSIEGEGLEVAMVLTLVPLCSPLSWTYFYCWLLPAWSAVGFWLDNPLLTLKSQRIVKCGAIIGGLLLASAVSEQIDPTLQACGVTSLGSVTLFLTMAYVRFTLPNRASVSA